MPPRNQALLASNANLLTNSCVGRLGDDGSLLTMPTDWNRERQFAATWSNTIPGPTPELQATGDLVTVQTALPTWWRVNLWGLEITQALAAADAQPALPRAQIVNQGLRHTRVKARINWENMQNNRSVDVDIGTGTRLSICANAVRIEALLPVQTPGVAPQLTGGFVEVGTVIGGTAPGGPVVGTGAFDKLWAGLKIDALVGASCYPVHSPDGCCEATYSQIFQVLPGATAEDRLIPIPPGARAVSIYDVTPGSPFRFIEFFDSIPFTVIGPVVGTMDSSATGQLPGTVQRAAIPHGVASHIQTPTLQLGLFTIVWHLEL